MIALLSLVSLTMGSVVPPHFTRTLVYPFPAAVSGLYLRTNPFWAAELDRPVHAILPGKMGGKGWREVRPNDDAVRVDENGNLVSIKGNHGFYVEWKEPVARKALLFSYSNRFLVNGREETGHIHLAGTKQLVPVNLKKGMNSYLATGAALFQLLPVNAPISILSDTAVIPDAGPGDQAPFVASVAVTNAGDAPRRVNLKAQVDGGPITTTVTDSIPAMDSRIARFNFSISPGLKVGAHQLKLSGDGVDPCQLDFSVTALGTARRATYVSRFDGMVRGYSIQESLRHAGGQPIVMFTYGGGRASILNLSQIHAKSWCHVVSPEFRTTNWDGLGRRDALETLEVATKRLKADRTRSYLLGHSMGGHAVYVMAAQNPKAFAGIALSAAWLSNFTYLPEEYPEIVAADPVAKMFRRSMSEIDLENRLDDIAAVKNVWMVHGDKDRSVKIAESYRILNELEKRGTRVGLFVRPGAGHVWEIPNGGGNQYDYPPIFEALRTSTRRGTGDVWGGIPVPPFFAQCMGRRCVAIYGAHGTPDENSEAWDRARRESVIARERFDVDCEVLPDTVTLSQIAGRNVVLFGTPSSNRLWKLHPIAESLVNRARKRGTRFTSWLIQARRGEQVWSAIGGSDAEGCRLAYLLDPTDSYRRVPEWMLFDRSTITLGVKGVAAAGFAGGPEAWR